MDRIHHLLHTDITSKLHIGIHLFIKGLGISFVAVFIPAILYTTFGFTLAQIFLFIAGHSLCTMGGFYFLSSPLIAKQGTKVSMMIGVVCCSIYLLLLGFGKQIPELILIAPLFSGLHSAFFWGAYHVSMTLQAQGDKKLGQNIALLEIAGMTAAMIGPLLGGMITDFFGTLFLFVSAGIFAIASLIPLRLDDHVHEEVNRKPHISKNKFQTMQWNTILPFAGLGYIQFVGSTVLSILLFLQFESFTKLGLISLITSLVVMGAMRLAGRRGDKGGTKVNTLLKINVLSQSSNRAIVGGLLMMSFFSSVVFVVADAVHKLTYKISTNELNKFFYMHTISNNMKDVLENTLYHEFGFNGLRFVMCLILAGLSYFIDSEKALLIIPIFLVILIAPLQLTSMGKRSAGHEIGEKVPSID